jgi:hypothetical protein
MNKLFLILLLFAGCNMQSGEEHLVFTNTSSTDLTDKAISIERSQLKEIPEGSYYPLLISLDGDTLPAQLNDLDGDKVWDELFLVVDLSANEEIRCALTWVEKAPPFPVRTSVRFGKRTSIDAPVEPAMSEVLPANELPKSLGYQRYQTDGPSWENDKVGFRHYLDGRNAKDLFGKKIAAISPEDVGVNAQGAVEDTYHVMRDWGRDILSVGNSVGIGGYGLIAGDSLMRLGVTVNDAVNNVEETRFRIVAEGPVCSKLNYQYKTWKAGGRIYSVDETTSIWRGMYGYQNEVKFSGLVGDEHLVIGLVNINTEMPITEINENEKYVVLYTHDKQTYEKEWWLGLALILPRDLYVETIEAPKTGQLSNTFLAKLKIQNEQPVEYYAVACWELSDERFKDPAYFRDYLLKLTSQLSAEVTVSFR